jgi:hypothetical protein
MGKQQLEDLRRRREAREQQRLQQGVPETGGLRLKERVIDPVLRSGPAQFLMQAGPSYDIHTKQKRFEAMEAAGTSPEDMGDYMAPPDRTFVERGKHAFHQFREGLSTAADIASDITPQVPWGRPGERLLPESFGEWLDPSKETEIGQRVEAEMLRFENENDGRKPDMNEQYGIMASVQDEMHPWLGERFEMELPFQNPIGPEGENMKIGMSKRMASGELASEFLVGAMELGGAYGASAVGKGLVGAAKMIPKTTGVGKIVSPAAKAGAWTSSQILQIPLRVEHLFDAVVGGGFKYLLKEPIKAAYHGAKFTPSGFSRTISWLQRRGFSEMGEGSSAAVHAQTMKTGQTLIDQNLVEGISPGTKMRQEHMESVQAVEKTLVQVQGGLSSATQGRAQRRTPFFDRPVRSNRTEAERLMKSSDPGEVVQGERMYRDIMKDSSDYVRGILEPTYANVNVRPNAGLFAGDAGEAVLEPSLYITADVAPEQIDQFIRTMVDIADTDFGQDSVMIHFPEVADLDAAVPWGKYPEVPKKSPAYTVEPSVQLKTARGKILTGDEIDMIFSKATEKGLAGFAIRPDNTGIDFVNVSAYTDPDEFIKQVVGFTNDADIKRILRRVTTGTERGGAYGVQPRRLYAFGEKGGFDGYDSYRSYHNKSTGIEAGDKEGLSPWQKNKRSKDRFAEHHRKALTASQTPQTPPSAEGPIYRMADSAIPSVPANRIGRITQAIRNAAIKTLDSNVVPARLRTLPIVARLITDRPQDMALTTGEAKKIVKQYRARDDEWQTQIEGVASISGSETVMLVQAGIDTGVFNYNMGGASGRRLADIVDSDMSIALESGNLVSGLLEAGKKVNITLNSDYFKKIGLPDLSFKGRTLVDANYLKLYPDAPVNKRWKNPISGKTEWVALNLEPSFADVVQRKSLYKKELEAIEIKLPDGSTITLNDLIDRSARWARRGEDQLVREGMNNVRTAPGVNYDAGDAYFPFGPTAHAQHGLAPPPKNRMPQEVELNQETMQWVATPLHRRRPSQAQGMLEGIVYANPGDALADYMGMVGTKARSNATGDYIQRVTREWGLDMDTAENLLTPSKPYKALKEQIKHIQKKIANAAARQKRLPKRSARLLETASSLMEDFDEAFRIAPALIDDKPGAEGTLIDAVTRLEKSRNQWKTKWARLQRDADRLKMFTAKEMKDLNSRIVDADRLLKIFKEDALKDMGTIGGIGIEGHFFPVQLRDAMFKEIESLRKAEDPGRFSKMIRDVNSTLRMLNATGDYSGVGVQGLAGAGYDLAEAITGGLRNIGFLPGGGVEMKIKRQGTTATAVRTMVNALRNENVMGEFFWKAEKQALADGHFTPLESVQMGLAILYKTPDISVRGTFLGNAPIIKQADRMFTTFGNVGRWLMWDGEVNLDRAMKGMTKAEYIESGLGTQAASAINNLYGVGQRGFMGELGQFVFFAPRFFQARLKTMSDVIMGIAPGTQKTAQRRLARKVMGRYVAFATTTTILLNDAVGEDTDINPFLRSPETGRWHFNPNFMRIKLGQLDISLFGPWDSMLRMAMSPFFLILNGYSAQQKGELWEWDTLGQSIKDLRSNISAPISGITLDMLFGEDAIGQKTRAWEEGGPSPIEMILEYIAPFASDDLFMGDAGKETILDRFVAGGAGEKLTAVAQAALQGAGAKSSYESLSETEQAVYADFLAQGPDDPMVQEAFGVTDDPNTARMTVEELRKLYAEGGKNLIPFLSTRRDLGVKLNVFGRNEGDLLTWDQVAGDIRGKIKDMFRDGRLSEFMSPEEFVRFQKQVDQRLESSKAPYSRYAVEKKEIQAQQEETFARLEEVFLMGGTLELPVIDPQGKPVLGPNGRQKMEVYPVSMGDFGAVRKLASKFMGKYSRQRRALTGERGPYEGLVEDLFEWGRQMDLGKLSYADTDIYDAMQAHYYERLYPEEGMSIVKQDESVDWDLREERVNEWMVEMRERYPNLSEAQVNTYRFRIEDAAKQQAPPAVSLLMDMQDFVGDVPITAGGATYYDLETEIIEDIVRMVPGSEETIRDAYRRWDWAGTRQAKSQIESQHTWLKDVSGRRAEKLNMALSTRLIGLTPQQRARRERIEGMLVLLGKRGTEATPPITPYGSKVYRIVRNHRSGEKKIADIKEFLTDVYNRQDLSQY